MRLLRTLSLCLAAGAGLAAPLAAGEADKAAAEIVKDSRWNRGICVDLGADPKLAVALAKSSELSIYRVERDAAAASRTRKLVEAAGLSPLRVRVEIGPLEKLAYPPYCTNLILAERPSKGLLRLLRPAGGVAYFRSGASSPGKGFKLGKGPGGWTRLERLPLEGAGDWKHNGYDATNNRYSPDRYVKPPFRILWYGDPIRSFGTWWTIRGLAAKGRYFLTDLSPEYPDRAWITAKDAYNGIVLWEREAGGTRFSWRRPVKGEDPNWLTHMNQPGKVHTDQMVIAGDRLYLTDATRLMVISAASGKDITSFKAPPPSHPKNHWTYVAHADGKLFGYAAASYRAPYASNRYWARRVVRSKEGGPATVFALDPNKKGRVLWVRGGNGEKELGKDFCAPMAIGAGRVFLRSGKDLYALDSASGKTAWVVRGVEKPEENTFWNGTVVDKKLHLYRYDRRFYCRRAVLPWPVFAVADGKRLGEERPARSPLAFFDSAKKVCRPHSGGNGCPLGTGAGKVLFSRNSYYVEGGGYRHYGGFRAGCRVGALPANGVVHLLPACGCHCALFSATITLEPGKTNEKIDAAPAPTPEKLADLSAGEAKPAAAADWPAFRADAARTAVTAQDLSSPMKESWKVSLAGRPAAPVAVGGLVFVASSDERVHALRASDGKRAWTFYSTGPVSASPFYWKGRVYFGSHDGWVYCLAAASGKLLWRFRAAPFARRQAAFGRLISAWPIRQGLAVGGGKVYFTCGRVPNQGAFSYAVDATSGKLLWRKYLRGVIPSGSIAIGPDRIFVPTELCSAFVQFLPADGSRPKGGGTGHFTEMSYVVGAAADDAKHKKGFLVHGGGGVGRGHPKKTRAYGFPYNLHPAPWTDKPLARGRNSHTSAFADGRSLLPVFGKKRVYFRRGYQLVAVDRAKLSAFRAIRSDAWQRNRYGRKRKYPRDKLLAWDAGKLPCGEPGWALLAKDTVLTGGPKGVTAVNAADGKPRWSLALPGSTELPAVSRGRVFLTSPDGTVRCLDRR